MNNTEITEGNKLIADYMDYLNKYKAGVYYYAMNHAYHNGNLKYHSSWEWLMPVVEKIESMGHKTIIGGGDVWGNYMNIMHNVALNDATVSNPTKSSRQAESKKETVFVTVVAFIKWHNEQKLKSNDGTKM